MIVTGEPTGPPATDAAVIEQSWAEPERFEAIFRRYFGRIHQYLAARVGARIADDLAAEVFTIAFAQRQRYDLARECARPWLYGIATNLAGTYRRQEQRRYRALARAGTQAVPRWPGWAAATGTYCSSWRWLALTTRKSRSRLAFPTAPSVHG